jgi:hypothetical protein
VRTVLVVLAASACAAPRTVGPDVSDAPAPPRDAIRYYTLWWHGERIGSAVEEERATRSGIHLERRERVVVRRGDQLSATELVIAIDADAALRATAVTATLRDGATERLGRAERSPDGWRITVDGEPPRTAPADAEPSELVPLIVRRDGGFTGAVLLPGRGFAIARGRVEREGPDRYRASITTELGALEAAITVDGAGDAVVVAAADGVVARRASAAEVARRFAPAEAIAAGALAVTGAVGVRDTVDLRIAAITRGAPPPLPGQRVRVGDDGWRVALDAALPGALPPGRGTADVTAIAALARRVAADITDDLGASATGDPRHAVAGDCTVHALAFAARAGDAGIDTRIVTGYRLDGDHLIRHRWALAWTGAAWIAVDPTFGEAPAAPRLLGLAVHGVSSAELALADAAFAGTGGARVSAVSSAGTSR